MHAVGSLRCPECESANDGGADLVDGEGDDRGDAHDPHDHAFRDRAETADGEIMGIRHTTLPIYGVQFHPEPILSEHGHALLQNFLNL